MSLPIRNPYARSNEPYRSSAHVHQILARTSLLDEAAPLSSQRTSSSSGPHPVAASATKGNPTTNYSSRTYTPSSTTQQQTSATRKRMPLRSSHGKNYRTSAEDDRKPAAASGGGTTSSTTSSSSTRKRHMPNNTTAAATSPQNENLLNRSGGEVLFLNGSATTTHDDKPLLLLNELLPQLRPFQREALEFAVAGKRYQRQFADGAQGQQQQQPVASSQKNNNNNNTTMASPNGRILLADEMGLGKTITSLAIMAYYQTEWPLLILCPASLRYTWPSEIEKFMPRIPPHAVHVCTGFQDVGFVDTTTGRVRRDLKVVVVTYSLFQQRSAVSHAIADSETPLFRCIICDESHHLKQKDSQRCQMLLPTLQQCERLVLLSGTPALSRPMELWTQLYSLAPALTGSWNTFANRYCNPTRQHIGRGRYKMDYTGSSNAVELHGKLRQVMVRRLKASVLTELPPKQRTIVPVTMSAQQLANCRQAMQNLNDAKRAADNDLEQFMSANDDKNPHWEAKAALMKAYQQTGIGKAAAIAEYLTTVWLPGSEGSKILVFAHHQEVLDTIEEALLKAFRQTVQHIRIDGRVPSLRRAQLVRQFQTASTTRVALLSMTAAGVGLTLTAADTVLFAELHWTPGVLAQAEDRAHRLGQRAAQVQILYMVNRDESVSVDTALWNSLAKKILTLDQIVDGKKETPYLLQAQEGAAAASGKEGGTAPAAKSVQDELTEFFAKEGQGNNKQQEKKNASPVKGSILSFFRKAEKTNAGAHPSTAKKRGTISGSNKSRDMIVAAASFPRRSSVSSSARASMSTSSGDDDFVDLTQSSPTLPQQQQHYPASVARTTEQNLEPQMISWSCSVCTLENERPLAASGYYACGVCNEPYMPLKMDVAASDVLLERDETISLSLHSDKGRNRSVLFTPKMAPGRSSAATEVIVLDSDDDDNFKSPFEPGSFRTSSGSNLSRKRRKTSSNAPSNVRAQQKPAPTPPSDVIVLDFDDEGDDDVGDSSALQCAYQSHCLKFSISKNTGRITVHVAGVLDRSLDSSTLVNFDVQDVITEECSNRLLDAQITHANDPRRQSLSVEFDGSRVDRLVERIVAAGGLPFDRRSHCASEIQEFVSNYIRLREVEKNALKQSGQNFSSTGLALSSVKLLNRSSTFSNDRYSGGAKERALENEKNGCATDADRLILNRKACAWCGCRLSSASVSGEATYCTEECAVEGRLRRGGRFASANIRSALFALEGGKCSLCGIDAHSLYKQILVLKPPERLNKLLSVNWKMPKTKKAMESLLNDPNEGNFWQADHIRAVAEGGGDASLENFRTLCVPCHSVETSKLHRRLLLQSPKQPEGSGDSSTKRKQADIRTAFANATQSSGA